MLFGFGRGRGSRGGWGWGKGFRGPGARGFGQGGPPEACICPGCGTIIPHRRGIPCFQTKCPRCNSPMTRQFFYEE